MPRIFFHIPSRELIDQVPSTIQEYNAWIDGFRKIKPVPRPTGGVCTFGGPYHWTVQTYIYLRNHGYPCELVPGFPEEGIIITHGDLLPQRYWPSERQFIVEIKPDRHLQCVYANFVVVQNRRDPIHNEKQCWHSKSAFVNNWPQPGLIPRSTQRGTRFENVGFFGRRGEFIKDTDALEQGVRDLGLNWTMPPQGTWHDYSELDCVVAVRPGKDPKMLLRKPATRLTNSWAVGVPAILSPDIAFEDIRVSDLDYVRASNIEQILSGLTRLQRDPLLRKAMADNGLTRAKEFTPERTIELWIDAIENQIVPEYDRWRTSRLRRTVHYLTRTLVHKVRGIDPA
jgi:hypothetical protein